MNRNPVINPNRSSTKIGYIYKITAPNGHSYIGQTIQNPDERLRQHIYNAENYRNDCTKLENAIRKHTDSMKHEILMIINENLLDYYETIFIEFFNTKTPNGYNLRDGGNGGCTEEMRAQMRIGNDKKLANKSWPDEKYPRVKYIYWYHETNSYGTALEGWRVSDHPNGRSKTIADSNLSMDDKYELAIKYKEFLDNYVGYFDDREQRPMHLGKYKNTGYKVRKPGFPSKWFNEQTKGESYSRAFAYLVSITMNHEFDKVFKNILIPYFED